MRHSNLQELHQVDTRKHNYIWYYSKDKTSDIDATLLKSTPLQQTEYATALTAQFPEGDSSALIAQLRATDQPDPFDPESPILNIIRAFYRVYGESNLFSAIIPQSFGDLAAYIEALVETGKIREGNSTLVSFIVPMFIFPCLHT